MKNNLKLTDAGHQPPTRKPSLPRPDASCAEPKPCAVPPSRDKGAFQPAKNQSKMPIFQVEPARTRQKICTPFTMTLATADLSTIPSALASVAAEAPAKTGHQEKPGKTRLRKNYEATLVSPPIVMAWPLAFDHRPQWLVVSSPQLQIDEKAPESK